jgi:hypothetical protein
MNAWAKQSAERIREANDRTKGYREWYIFKRNEILSRGGQVWRAIINECQQAADCFNSELHTQQHPDAIQPFLSSTPLSVVIRQLNFPETRVECAMNLEAREFVVTWYQKASYSSVETHRQIVLDLDVLEETGDLCVKRNGTPLTMDQIAEMILTPLMNRREYQSSIKDIAS